LAKIVTSSLINEIKGSLSGSTFRSNRAGVHFYRKPHPRNPKSPKQISSRSNYSLLTNSWSSLTVVQKSLWDQYASLTPKPMTGFNAFISLNSRLINANYSSLLCVDNPPLFPDTPPPVSGFFIQKFDSDTLTVLWDSPSSDSVKIRISFALCFGSSLNWQYISTQNSPTGFYNFPFPYPIDSVFQFRIRSILHDASQGSFSYSPSLSSPVKVLLFSAFYNHKLSIVYQNTMELAAERFGDSFSSSEFGNIYDLCSDSSYIWAIDSTNKVIHQINKYTFKITSVWDNPGADPDNDIIDAFGICNTSTHVCFVSSGHSLVCFSKSDFSSCLNYISPNAGDPTFWNFQHIHWTGSFFLVTHVETLCGFSAFDSSLNYIASYSSFGIGEQQMRGPAGIWADDTYIYVVDWVSIRLSVWYLSTFTWAFNVDSFPGLPFSIDELHAISGDDDYLYISDINQSHIFKLNKSDFSFVNQLGSGPKPSKQFSQVYGLLPWQE